MKARLDLRFDASGGQTRLQVGVQDPPWRVVRAFPQSKGGAYVHLLNVSGGVLSGDRLCLDVQVGPRARAQITSTGATRLYRHRKDSPDSEQSISISVAEDGLLEYLPDALIPFAGSRHRQQTVITLADRAAFFWWEVMAPGRQAMGEQFRFDSLRVRTRVQSLQGPLLLEDYSLEPCAGSLSSPARLGFATHTASFYAFQVGRPPGELRELEAQLGEIALQESRPGCTIWGASALASDGVIVRGMSTTARYLPATLARFWSTARHFLTGEEAVPPRKLK